MCKNDKICLFNYGFEKTFVQYFIFIMRKLTWVNYMNTRTQLVFKWTTLIFAIKINTNTRIMQLYNK